MALTKTGPVIGLVVLVALAGAIGYFGWRTYTTSEHPVCQVCERPLHDHSRTVAIVDGKTRESFCCPTCAATAARQNGERLQFVELTDFVSGATLAPQEAILVRGSDVNPCLEEHALIHGDKQAAQMDFDRCSPSILAFADVNLAEEFIGKHGGTLVSIDDIAEE
jgi:hypothetical protein